MSDRPSDRETTMQTDTRTTTTRDAAAFARGQAERADTEAPSAQEAAELARDARRTERDNAEYEDRRSKALASGGWTPSLSDREEAEMLGGLIDHAHHWVESAEPQDPWVSAFRSRATCTRDGIFRIEGIKPEHLADSVALIGRRSAAGAFAGIAYEAQAVDGVLWVRLSRPEPDTTSTPPF